jgi:hypothetical protein
LKLLLIRDGRIRIGPVRPSRWRWVLPAVIAGVAMALAVYAGATALWAPTVSNRFAYLAEQVLRPGGHGIGPADLDAARTWLASHA